MTPHDLHDLQSQRLQQMLAEVSSNVFIRDKLADAAVEARAIRSISDVRYLPFTTRAELLADQARYPPYGSNLTYTLTNYTRLHQSSGSAGQPLRWLDTQIDWSWMLDCWDQVYRTIGIRAGDRLFFPFSFGPFLGFWTAFEAATHGMLSRENLFCMAGGGISTNSRIQIIINQSISVVLCTPTYALRMAEAALAEGIDLAKSSVRALIVAGEPGGCVPATRNRIESAWGARVFDHHGMTEIGPASVECIENPGGIHILETEFIAEVIDPKTTEPVAPGTVGELVLTNLQRWGSPLIRYRTGDLVCVDPQPCPCGSVCMRLAGGILGRADDMIHVRGNNVFPSALEDILRSFPEIVEYQIELDERGAMCEVNIQIEPVMDVHGLAEAVSRSIHDRLLFRANVNAVSPGSLPRFEMKAKRVRHVHRGMDV
jgi:phenylacetate-CoA ligase